MDSLDIIMQTVREELARGAADADRALDDAELRTRRMLGGAKHYISRMPTLGLLQQIQRLPPNLTAAQVAARVRVSPGHARRLLRQLRP